jgi:ankyrin repeat protein
LFEKLHITTGTYKIESLLIRTLTICKDDMKRLSSNTSPRKSLPPAHIQSTDKENIQPNNSITEHPTTTLPQFSQRPSLDRSNVFPETPTATQQFQATNLRLINSITEKINPPLLTDDLYLQLVDTLSAQDFETAMRIAGVRGLQELYELTNQDQETLLIVATKEDDTEVVKALLNKLSNPDSFAYIQDKYGCTALMYAVRTNNTELIKVLLCGVNDRDMLACMKDNYGHTALMHAAAANEPESITILLSMMKNPEALAFMTDELGMNALMLAAYRDCSESIIALLNSVRNGKNLAFMKNVSDFNALMLAALGNHTESIKALLDNIKNPEDLVYFSNNKGITALMICCKNESELDFNPEGITAMLKTVKNIRDPDSLIFLKDSDGMNAFMIAAKENNDLAVATLFYWATDKLVLLKEKDNKEKIALNLLDTVLCAGLIRLVNGNRISVEPQDLNEVLYLLQQRVQFH